MAVPSSMAGRRPLSAKNAEPPRNGAKGKKERYKLLSRQALVETLSEIFKGVSPPISICEEDLLKPTVSSLSMFGRARVHLPSHHGCPSRRKPSRSTVPSSTPCTTSSQMPSDRSVSKIHFRGISVVDMLVFYSPPSRHASLSTLNFDRTWST